MFFPKPLNFFPADLDEYDMIKAFKKAKFISTEHLKKILSGENIENQFFHKDYILNGCWRVNKSVKTEEDTDKIYEGKEIPHIVMDRLTNQTQIFYKTEIYFNKEAGLFFLAEVKNELVHEFETVLRFLGDEGIGADRSIGKGFFEIEEIKDFSLKIDAVSEYYYLLSLYSPTKDEFERIEPRKSYYDFVIRGGWISNNSLNRKSLRMFVEGSVLKFTDNQKPVGCLQKVLEKKDYEKDLIYDIYRSGQALFLPVSGGIDGNN
jgi:CRISPR-associated protein Csm4